MKIALDPYMIRHLSLEQLPGAVAALGYDHVSTLTTVRLSGLVGYAACHQRPDQSLQSGTENGGCRFGHV